MARMGVVQAGSPLLVLLLGSLSSSTALAVHTVDVTPCIAAEVGSSTSIHPRDIPRSRAKLTGTVWSGAEFDGLSSAVPELLKRGFAVLESPEALFRETAASKPHPSFNPDWFQTTPTAQDTTTIPFTDWLPKDTEPGFTEYLYNILSRCSFDECGESFLGCLSIGGIRRRNMKGKGPQENLYFPHQDESKLSVLMSEFVAHGDARDPFLGLTTVDDKVRHAFAAGFRCRKNDPTTRPGSGPSLICRQINFWMPHERAGDKFLLFLTRAASEALVEAQREGQCLITACELPRASTLTLEDNPELFGPNQNFCLTDEGLSFVQKTLPEEVFLVNKPILFVSQRSMVGAGRPLWHCDDASQGIFHCGAILQGKGHGSTEMRVSVFSGAPPE